MKIGKLKLRNNLFLAPMVDVTDLPYRLICRGVLSNAGVGCGMAYTEMIYVSAILHSNKKTLRMLKTCKEDSPIGLQIAGNNVEEFEKFVKMKKVWSKFDLIDLNCGCPSSRITGNCAGSFLLKEPEKIAAIVKVLKKTGKPVGVKVRLGFSKVNVLEVAKLVEKAGADAITVHCRLAKWGNDKKADWSYLGKIKKVVKIPVIGNGDVASREDYLEILKTGCDGVMIGRGAIGNPLIFGEILNKKSRPVLRGDDGFDEGKRGGVRENLKLFLEYLDLEKKYFGKDVELSRVKWLGGKFIRGFKGSRKMREKFGKLKTLEEMKSFVRSNLSFAVA